MYTFNKYVFNHCINRRTVSQKLNYRIFIFNVCENVREQKNRFDGEEQLNFRKKKQLDLFYAHSHTHLPVYLSTP